MKIQIISEKKIITDFLSNISKIANEEGFDINTDFFINYKIDDDERYSTITALTELEYGDSDVLEIIKNLNIKNYSHTLIDNDPRYDGELLHVFGKYINENLIYIKLKIRNSKKVIICISFHYAKEKLDFPYDKTKL